MRTLSGVFAVLFALLFCIGPAGAATYYVATNGSDAAAGTNWATAKQTIQAAVDAAAASDTVLVSNGVYQSGTRVTPGGVASNRVVVDKAITVQSMNGPSVTTIRGNVVVGTNAVRCVYLGPNAVLSGFTLTNGGTRDSGGGDIFLDLSGGGVLGSSGSVVTNCVIDGNVAFFGAGASRGLVANSVVRNNSASANGGGLFQAAGQSCLILSNSAAAVGGGVRAGSASNCVIAGNSASSGGGAEGARVVHCTIVSNISAGSGIENCSAINSIVYFTSGGGANQLGSSFTNSCTTPLAVGPGNISSDPQLAGYRLTETSPCIDAGTNDIAGATDLDGGPRVVRGRTDIGAYEFQFRFVNISNPSPVYPYLTWSTAATNIQDAVDASIAGALVLVSNGLYQTGGRVFGDAHSNRVVIDKPIAVRSVNGPSVTSIRGAFDPSATNGPAAVRCVYLTAGSLLSGFTITNGATSVTGNGGGISSAGVVSNCVITGNSADVFGGGVYGGTVVDSLIIGNRAYNRGGGASHVEAHRCSVMANVGNSNGGAYLSILYDCLITGNQGKAAGGTEFSDAYNCTISGNSATISGAGGCRQGHVYNSLVVFNTGQNANYESGTVFTNSCTSPLPSGPGNIDANPLFVNAAAGDYRLKAGSPCINAGSNAMVSTSLDRAGNPRIAGGTVDMGAYEYNQALATYDSDGDTWSDADEFISDTQPTNNASFFRRATVTNAPAGQMALVINLTSTGRVYGVFANTNLLQTPQVWTLVPPEQTGTSAALTLTITNSLPAANYRTGVRLP